MHGIAGFYQNDHTDDSAWENSERLSHHLPHCKFHNEVRSLKYGSYKKSNTAESQLIRHLARELGINNASYIVWRMKHDNHGVLIYEVDNDDADVRKSMHDAVHYLSFCPIL